MHPISVLSAFDGHACGLQALKRSGIPVKAYYASEIDQDAMKIAQKNHPEIVQCGDVVNVSQESTGEQTFDLLIGGSPCQGFSREGGSLNFEHKESKLFFEFVRLKDEFDPTYFMMENVFMKAEYRDIISEYLNVEPILINSKLVSAQNRLRYYWTNIPVEQPPNKGITLSSVLESAVDIKHYELTDSERSVFRMVDGEMRCRNATKKGYLVAEIGDGIDLGFPKSRTRRGRVISQKSHTLTTSCSEGVRLPEGVRKLTITECERLQGLPDGYTKGVSNTQRKRMIGNGWNVDTIVHILNGIK